MGIFGLEYFVKRGMVFFSISTSLFVVVVSSEMVDYEQEPRMFIEG